MRTLAKLFSSKLTAEELLAIRGGENPPAKDPPPKHDWSYTIKDTPIDDSELWKDDNP